MNLSKATRSVKVLDMGYVRLSRIMADVMEDGQLRAVTDNSVADDARVSFDKRAEEFPDAQNRALVEFLGKEGHTSPFRGCVVQFEVFAPMFVRNQWYKYVIGSHHNDGIPRDPYFQWNEVSRRYVTRHSEIHKPEVWRAAPPVRRQGSAGPVDEDTQKWAEDTFGYFAHASTALYREAINRGICAEQARLFLPGYAIYTGWRWTASLQSVCHFLAQRLQDDAQKEIQEYARAVYSIIQPLFPNAVDNLVRQHG